MDVTDQVVLGDTDNNGRMLVTCHVLMSLSQRGGLKGSDVQTFSTEMLHWDDYREECGINDGTPSMKSTFQNSAEAPFDGILFSSTDGNVKALSLVVDPALSGSDVQNFCTEMQHWDDYRLDNNIRDGVQPMKDMFDVFSGHEMYILNAKDKLSKLRHMCVTSCRQSYGCDAQHRTSELVHWEEYQAMQSLDRTPKLDSACAKR
uniref:WGS project CAEQ00000000 data, annotated contig 1624 n=1 Tax=Trypanosoma congolense (strain IL3000) TaxID=1068625 RepID=F9W7K6_TRYCI|nr:unnamed protein product [Trypanosoma congolense IL3000]